jgi:hypothetical protein
MGEIGPIIGVCGANSPGMTPNEILAVINPPASDRDRSALVAQGNTVMPGQAAWRMATPVGKRLESGVRTNHFPIESSRITGTIANYHVHIYKVQRDGTVDTVDIAATEDSRVTTSLMLKLKKRHPEWDGGKVIGFTYDNRSSLFTSQRLPLPGKNDRNEPFLSEIIGMSTIDGIRIFFVVSLS